MMEMGMEWWGWGILWEGSLGCVVFHVRTSRWFNGRSLMRVGLGSAPSAQLFFMSSYAYYLLAATLYDLLLYVFYECVTRLVVLL